MAEFTYLVSKYSYVTASPCRSPGCGGGGGEGEEGNFYLIKAHPLTRVTPLVHSGKVSMNLARILNSEVACLSLVSKLSENLQDMWNFCICGNLIKRRG